MKSHGRMDESILVCVYYGPNSDRLIRRGHKIATMLDCPLYVLNISRQSSEEFDSSQQEDILNWQALSQELDIDGLILKTNEDRPIQQVIAEVCNEQNISQVVIGQTAQSRWEEITKGSFINQLLRALPFVDIHVISVDRQIRVKDHMYEKAIRAYLVDDAGIYRIYFDLPETFIYEGLFYKELGTDFDNGRFKFMHEGKTYEIEVDDGYIHDETVMKNLNL
ncbi:hypothetical protein KSI01_04980 [Kurthia sibirica]|nr:universal stress protein [Kurthia sibirica]GEK32965.1 hypothetical protein KSI01_04980 [Kurthia sibirica]